MELSFSYFLLESTTTTEGLPLSLLIPVVVALCSVIVYLYCERKKDHNKKSDLEKEFRKKIEEADQATIAVIVKTTDSHRKEIAAVVKAAYTNNTKVAEILTALNLKSDTMLSEIQNLNVTFNNLYLRLHDEEWEGE